MLKTLIPSDDPLLHKKIKKCSYDLDRSKLSYTLTENMFHHNGVGLSANQIGIEERAFVMMIDIDLMEEGCLSYPELFIEISRPRSIIVKYEDEGKSIFKRRLDGYIARIFQHEYDHMEGIDFTQR